MQFGIPRPCHNDCGQNVEWSLDREHRATLVESQTRQGHMCPRRVIGSGVECRDGCGNRVTLYADGRVANWPVPTAHTCIRVPLARPQRPRAPEPSVAIQEGARLGALAI